MKPHLQTDIGTCQAEVSPRHSAVWLAILTDTASVHFSTADFPSYTCSFHAMTLCVTTDFHLVYPITDTPFPWHQHQPTLGGGHDRELETVKVPSCPDTNLTYVPGRRTCADKTCPSPADAVQIVPMSRIPTATRCLYRRKRNIAACAKTCVPGCAHIFFLFFLCFFCLQCEHTVVRATMCAAALCDGVVLYSVPSVQARCVPCFPGSEPAKRFCTGTMLENCPTGGD